MNNDYDDCNDHVVTDHALVRYIERVLGGNIKEMKDFILCEQLRNAVVAGATRVRKDGFVYTIRGGRVTTVMKRKNRRKK